MTDRCARDDLKVKALDDAHPLIAKFAALRAVDPEPNGEHISKTRPRTLYKVNAIESGIVWRGATWHDRKNEIVYLVAAGRHRSRERDDFYQRLPSRLSRIYPTQRDVDQVRLAAAARKVRELREERAPALIEVARQRGASVGWVEGCRASLVYDQDVFALRLDPRPNESLEINAAIAIALVFSGCVGRPCRRSDRQFGAEPAPKGSYVFYF